MDQKITIPIAVAIAVAVTAGAMYSAGFQGTEVPPVDSGTDRAMPGHDAAANMTGGNGTDATVEIGGSGDADSMMPANGTKGAEDGPSPFKFGQTHDIIRISTQTELEDILTASSALWNDRYQGNPLARQVMDFSGGGVRGDIAVGSMMMAESATVLGGGGGGGGSPSLAKGTDYSTTNVQVEGVDEPDYVKNDGNYVYIVSGNELVIIDAYPAPSARIVLKIAFDIEYQNIENMFLNGDRLVVFYNGQSDEEVIEEFGYVPRRSYGNVTHALIIDVSDRTRPDILRDYSIDGYFSDARMIGDYAYFVTSSSVNQQYPRLPVILEGADVMLTPDAFYFDSVDQLTNFSTLTAIDIFDETISSNTYLTGHSGVFYVSEDNFYITYQNADRYLYDEAAQRDRFFDVIAPLLPGKAMAEIRDIERDESLSSSQKWRAISNIMQDAYNSLEDGEREALFRQIEAELQRYDASIQEESSKTIIHKVSIDGSDIEYKAKGYVPGELLNQFSMDEYGDRFRIATTINYYSPSQGWTRDNAVYVLDEDLERVGGLEGIAPTESIFSARFIGERLYMVTFRQVDPFYVVDLSADKPRILGELKIPGFSDYLHPYDENHIIGVGRDSVNEGNRASQLGVKIAIFNVEDVSNPIVADDVIIGGRGTASAALDTHKAFFFDRASGLLSIPISGSLKDLDEVNDSRTRFVGERWNGFYVYDLSDAKFDLEGTITHSQDSNYWLHSGRTFYIEDILYTVSNDLIKMNRIDGLDEVNSIKFENTGSLVGFLN